RGPVGPGGLVRGAGRRPGRRVPALGGPQRPAARLFREAGEVRAILLAAAGRQAAAGRPTASITPGSVAGGGRRRRGAPGRHFQVIPEREGGLPGGAGGLGTTEAAGARYRLVARAAAPPASAQLSSLTKENGPCPSQLHSPRSTSASAVC